MQRILTLVLLGGIPGCMVATSTADSKAPGGVEQRHVVAPDRVDDSTRLPILDRPADPWAAVAGDGPVLIDDDRDRPRWTTYDPGGVTCTAKRDHCLPSIAWFWVQTRDPLPVKDAQVVGFTKDGPIVAAGGNRIAGEGAGFTAYRTVPATRANLAAGAIIVAVEAPKQFPETPPDAYRYWKTGVVESVDWDLGMVVFVGKRAPVLATGVRVAVLAYTPGGEVTIIGDKPRDKLAVAADDVILPD